MKDAHLMSFLYSARSSPIGLLLFSPEPERLRQALYRARNRALDPSLDALEFRLISPTELAICHPLDKGNQNEP